MFFAFSVDFRFSNFYNFFVLMDKTRNMGIHFLNLIKMKLWVIKLSGIVEIITFSSPAPVV